MPAIFARFIPLLLIGLGAWLLVRTIKKEMRGGARERNGQTTFKPGWADDTSPNRASGQQGVTQVMQARDLAGLRDALTSAPIALDADLMICSACRSVYHATSVAAIARDSASHRAHCVNCKSDDLCPVHVVHDHA